jgi:hypothetical protein
MNTNFFICKNPTDTGGNDYLGLNLQAISGFIFTPGETPTLAIQFLDGGRIAIDGEDASRLLTKMNLIIPISKPADILWTPDNN